MTHDIVGLIFNDAEKLGTIDIGQDKLIFNTHMRRSSGKINRSAFVDMGDVVYFMFVGLELKKIGKAAGQHGWYGRMQEYGKNRFNAKGKETWDATTRKIYNHMITNYSDPAERKIDVYAIKAPKQRVAFVNQLTGETMTELIETAGTVEQSLIQLAYKQGYTLDFCREKETAK